MPITLNRKNVTALAKAIGTEDTRNLSYLQRLDLIAKALGLPNQATMMAVLNGEDAKPAPAALGEKPYEVYMAFGSDYTSSIDNDELVSEDDGGAIVYRKFGTREEMNAYFAGINDYDGWMEANEVAVRTPDPSGNTNPEFFAALDENPDLDFVNWHNARVEKMRLDDEEYDEDDGEPENDM